MNAEAELLKAVEALLGNEEYKVVLTIKLAKIQPVSNFSGRRGGRTESKPRIIAISAKRNPQTQLFNIKLHVIKASAIGLQMAKTNKLSALTSIEIYNDDMTGRSFYLTFDQKRDGTRPYWTTRTIDDRNQLLVCLLKLSRENLGKTPKVIGIDVVEMALWAQSHSKPLSVGVPLSSPLQGGKEEGSVAGSEGAGLTVQDETVVQEDLVSRVEEEDMEAMLNRYVIGIDETDAFSERLKKELSALEEANVHEILESQHVVEEVIDGLEEAIDNVKDMEEWLSVFNLKLKHMRQDIESIETQNNSLEIQMRNNTVLFKELEILLNRLKIPPQYVSLLTAGPLDGINMNQNLDATNWLANAFLALSPPMLDESYANMRVVKDRKADFERLKATFIKRSMDFFRNYFSKLAENLVNEKKKTVNGMPERSELKSKLKIYIPLFKHIQIMDINAITNLRKLFCQTFNLPLRRELRDFVDDLKTGSRCTVKGNSKSILENISSSESSPASEAYIKLLGLWMNFLNEEAIFFASLFNFDSQIDASEQKVFQSSLDELFDGVYEVFHTMCEWVYNVDPLRCIPMFEHTDVLLAEALFSKPANDAGLFLRKLLTDLHKRLKLLFSKYTDDVTLQIDKLDKMKQGGVLTFIPRFSSIARRMESYVQGSSRDMVDQGYNKILPSMFKVLDKISQQDQKTANISLLENYTAFLNSIYEIAQNHPTLHSFYHQAMDYYELAVSKYVEEIMNAQFEKLFVFRQKLKNLLITKEVDEIPLQFEFSQNDVQKLLRTQLQSADKSVQCMYSKMSKQLNILDLLPALWEKCEEKFMEKYDDLEGLVFRCYKQESLSPSSSEMRKIFKATPSMEVKN